MTHKGQIVEIPATSPLYRRNTDSWNSKYEELRSKSLKKYSLFDGFLVGEHLGIENFKLGQRKGINVGGKKAPLYVIGIDAKENRLFVGEGEWHPGLWTSVFSFDRNEFVWTESFETNQNLEEGISVEIANTSGENLISASFYLINSIIFLEFEDPLNISFLNEPISIFKNNIIIAEKKK